MLSKGNTCAILYEISTFFLACVIPCTASAGQNAKSAYKETNTEFLKSYDFKNSVVRREGFTPGRTGEQRGVNTKKGLALMQTAASH